MNRLLFIFFEYKNIFILILNIYLSKNFFTIFLPILFDIKSLKIEY